MLYEVITARLSRPRRPRRLGRLGLQRRVDGGLARAACDGPLRRRGARHVITSYSIHYTKLYELDGHLAPETYNALTTGGTPVSELATLGQAIATIVVGRNNFV